MEKENRKAVEGKKMEVHGEGKEIRMDKKEKEVEQERWNFKRLNQRLKQRKQKITIENKNRISIEAKKGIQHQS